MAALVESMFSTRCVPWHGLGEILSEAPTSEDALRLAGLDWTVNQNDVVVNGVVVPNYKANVRSSDNSVLGIVTDRYKIVQNNEAFAFTDELVGDENGVYYETAGSLKNGRTIWMLAKMPEQKILDDKFDPYICFTNSHDGTGAVKVCMTPIRVVCNNTLNFALTTAKRTWSCKHVGDISSKMEEAKYTLGLANKYMEELANYADKLANTKITDERIAEILDEMFPVNDNDTDRKKNNIKEMKDGILIAYCAPDIAKFKGTQYGFMNAVTDFVGHATPNRVTKDYQQNNWGRIMDGHPIVDKALELLCAKAA